MSSARTTPIYYSSGFVFEDTTVADRLHGLADGLGVDVVDRDRRTHGGESPVK
jgi:hypothetical protein